jgi:hypothetical protein
LRVSELRNRRRRRKAKLSSAIMGGAGLPYLGLSLHPGRDLVPPADAP